MPDNHKRPNVYIPFRANPAIINALDYYANKHNVTRSAIIREALYDYLKRQNETELPHPPDAEPVPVVYTQQEGK